MAGSADIAAARGAQSRDSRSDRAVAIWLLGCCAMVFAMVVIGGATRLTESGLSITEWRPLSGALPPWSEAEWSRLFEQYRQIPQYQAVFPGMSLGEFKTIFWWEYVHRLWGRLIGIAFALPFLYFLLRGRLDRRFVPRLAWLLLLGALQGALGWYMVQSGLAERTSVSQYRLVAHLALALAIYALLFWTALDLLQPAKSAAAPAGLRRNLWVIGILAAATILAGGFVAGLDAGRIYNEFPLMGGRLVPAEAFAADPAWASPFEDPATAQFTHRILAVTTLAAILAVWFRTRLGGARPPRTVMHAIDLLAGTVALQAGLGIAALLLIVPIALGAAHQAGAVAALSALLWALHALRGSRP